MSNIKNSIDELIGSTPLLRLNKLEHNHNLSSPVIAKLEYFNPAGSAKDRVAKNILDKVISEEKITPDTVVIEPTSGNTGIGLAAVAASRGIKTIIVMPDTMSVERIKTMKAYGAEVVLSDGKYGMTGAINKAEELKASLPSAIIAGQFVNPANPEAHYLTTGPEIWNDTDGKVDCFICGVGTGGTVTGTGHYLKEKNPDIKIIAVEPSDSAVLSGGKAGPHALAGIGAGFIPEALDTDVIDSIITVTTEEAYAAARELARTEGILAGISSGAALHAALVTAKEDKYKCIVVLLPDTGTRYLSTDLY